VDAPLPAYDPLALPVRRFVVPCRTERPLAFPPAFGATVGTTLAGAFGHALLDVACREGERVCGSTPDGGLDCEQPWRCSLPRLLKPRATAGDRRFPTPVLLRAPALEPGKPVSAFELHGVLWGRRAIEAQAAVEESVALMGGEGLACGGERIPFSTGAVRFDERRCVRARAEAARPAAPCPAVLLVLETATVTKREPRPGGERRWLEDLVGNAAYELAAWDMEDRDIGPALDGDTRDAYASAVRDQARAAVRSVDLHEAAFDIVDLGARRSSANRRRYGLRGVLGTIELDGAEEAWPWLVAIALGRAGQRRGLGCGEARLWLGAAP